MHPNTTPEDEKTPSNTPSASPTPTPSGGPRLEYAKKIARNTLLTLWGVLTVQGIATDKDLLKFDFLRANRRAIHAGGHLVFPNGGLRSVFEPAYFSVGAPEEVTQTVSFNSPQIYARKFDIGQSVDGTDHEQLTHMIKNRLSTYIMSSIYGEDFLENDYLRDVDQRAFQYRIKRIRFHASSSPEAMIHGLMSVMINRVDQENVALARIRLEKFKAALRDACAQLHIELPTQSDAEYAEEMQLSQDEQSRLMDVARTYPGGGEQLLTDYQLYCEQLQRGVVYPATALPESVLRVLNEIIGSKRTVWCEAEFVTEKGHVFLIPLYWFGLVLLWPVLRRWMRRVKPSSPQAASKELPNKELPKKIRLPRYTSDIVHTGYVKDRRDKEMIGRLVTYQFAQERLMNETIGVQIFGQKSDKKVVLNFSLLDPMHYGNLSIGTFDPSMYLSGLDLSPLIKARIEHDAQHGRAFNVLLYTLVMLQNNNVQIPSQEILMGWTHAFYLRYAEIPVFDENEEIKIPGGDIDESSSGVSDEALEEFPGETPTVEDVFSWADAGDEELFALTEKERRKSFSAQKHMRGTVKTRARLSGVLQMSAIDLHDIANRVVDKNKQIYDPSKKGRGGRDVRVHQHDQQYNHLSSANQGKGRTGRPKYSRTGVGTRDVYSKARSSKKMRHQPPVKK